jgi:hypothetical protein
MRDAPLRLLAAQVAIRTNGVGVPQTGAVCWHLALFGPPGENSHHWRAQIVCRVNDLG